MGTALKCIRIILTRAAREGRATSVLLDAARKIKRWPCGSCFQSLYRGVDVSPDCVACDRHCFGRCLQGGRRRYSRNPIDPNARSSRTCGCHLHVVDWNVRPCDFERAYGRPLTELRGTCFRSVAHCWLQFNVCDRDTAVGRRKCEVILIPNAFVYLLVLRGTSASELPASDVA